MSILLSRRILVATVVGALGICLWATETALVTFTTGLPTLEIVALAFAVAALLSPLVWACGGGSPLVAFRQPISAWLVTVPSLVLYHTCIYYAVHQVPATPAALLHGATPLFIVLGSAFLPGERLYWWHVAGAGLGAAGMLWLVDTGGDDFAVTSDSAFYLTCIGLAAGLWGVYSLLSRRLGDVPTSAMGAFYATAAVAAFLGHVLLETWVTPNTDQLVAIVLLGVFPMGLALYFWDYGVKQGDIQALGATSYVEPLIGGVLVVALGQGEMHWSMIVAALLIVCGSVLAAGNLWRITKRSILGKGEQPVASESTVEQRATSNSNVLLQDLSILLQCGVILEERMMSILPPAEGDLCDEPLTPNQMEDLTNATADAIVVHERVTGLLQELKQNSFESLSSVKLSSKQFSRLTNLAIDAIHRLQISQDDRVYPPIVIDRDNKPQAA